MNCSEFYQVKKLTFIKSLNMDRIKELEKRGAMIDGVMSL
jgi:hypothetical protein